MTLKRPPTARPIVVFLFTAGVVCWGALPTRAEPESNDGAALVAQLGHLDYTKREEAAAQLASLGLKVQDELMAGLRAEDAEVRRRCQRILVRVVEADYEGRIAALLADRDGGDHDLPGWDWFRETIGTDDKSRKLFARMLRAEPGLLSSAAQGPALAEEAFKLRFVQLIQQMQFPNARFRRQPTMESVAALLLVAANPQWQLPGQLVDNPQLLNFTRSGDFGTAMNQGEHKESARRLVGRWILIKGAPNMAQQKLRMALQFELPEGLPLALEMLVKPEAQAPQYIAYAAESIARLGKKEYAAVLLPLLDDERQCGRSGKRVIEVRDVAFAWLIYATDQDVEAYGQNAAKNWFEQLAKNPGIMFNFSQFGYEEPDQRVEAMKKWSEWLDENPLPTPPEDHEALVADRPAGEPIPDAQPPAPEAPVAGGLNMADRRLVRHLQEADRLVVAGEYTTAVRLLGFLLSAESDFVFRPDRETPLFRHLKPAAEQAIGLMPEEGRAAYQLLFGAEARHRLEEAVAVGNRQALARVSQDYFYTDAGAEAAYLLGASYWQAGQLFSAAACWQRLAESGRRARQFEPALSLQLAACWMAMGEPQRIPERLEQLRELYAAAPIEVAGQRTDWFTDSGEALRWLVGVLGHEPASTETHWSVFRGRPSRNPVAEGGSPYLVAEPLDAPEKSTLLKKAIERVRNDFFGRRRAALPTPYPLVVDDTIVLRTATRIRAVDAQSGKLRWEAAPDDPLGDLLAGSGTEEDELFEESLPTDLLSRLWQNLAYSALSSNGRLVYAVEGLPLQGMIGPQRIVIAQDGTRRLDCGALDKDNTLAAYDLTSGKLRWEVGGPSGDGERALAGTYFLGPPLPLGASLYCIADIGDQTALLVLDAATGALQWQRILILREEADPQQAMMRMPGFVVPRPQHPPRANGASPSYADGILVCPLANDQVAAVDLTTRSVIWLYEGQDDHAGETLAERRQRLARNQSRDPRPPTDRWVDTCVTTAGGSILLTPPESDQLICLRLVDGMEQWTAERGDGLYVGAVQDGVVVTVGRSGIRGLRLDNGEPAWNDELPLPPGALPSGRAFLSGSKLYVPLSTAEVMGIDVVEGRAISRSRSPAGIVPGNLVGLSNGVLSQSADGLWRFDLIVERERLAAKRIADAPDDAAAWAERGELLLCDGQIAKAIECLSRARELEPTDQSRQRLARAVTDGLWTDYQKFRPLAESLELDEMEPGQRASVLRAMGWGAQRAGDRLAALDTFLHLAHIDPAAETLEAISAAARVRRDRWLASRLDELLKNATEEERTHVEPRLAALSNEDRIRYLPFQPDTLDAWIQAGAHWVENEQAMAAEQRLRAALALAGPEGAPESLARLAGLLRSEGRPREASRVYAELAGSLADVVSLDGQTGGQLAEAIAAEDPAHPEHVAQPLWPSDTLEATSEKRDGRQSITLHVPVLIRPVDPRFDRPATIRVENAGRSLYGYDDLGRQTWELSLKPGPQNVGFRNGVYLAQGYQLGDIAVIWLVSRVCAVDLSGETPQLLWDHQTSDLGSNDPRLQHHIQRANMRRAQQMQQRGGALADDSSPMVVANGYVCFERNEELVAVDLETGDLLWTRDDVPERIDLFGDARYVFAVPSDANEEARVLCSLDGRELGRRTLPARSSRLATVGRRILTWEEDPQTCRVRLVDPWDDVTVWEREMAAETQAALVGPDGFAVLDPEGWLAVLRTDSGEPILETKLEVQPKLERIYVERYGEGFVIIANRPPEPTARRMHFHVSIPTVQVEGTVYCVDREGAIQWSAEVLDQLLERDLPPELPVLLFSKRRQIQVPRPEGGMTSKVQYAILCIDKRSGKVLHDEAVETHGQELEIRAADPKGGRIEILTQPLTFRLNRVK